MTWLPAPSLSGEARRRFLDLVIVGVLPRSLPQWAAPDCSVELALRMTADEELPWEVYDDDLTWIGVDSNDK